MTLVSERAQRLLKKLSEQPFDYFAPVELMRARLEQAVGSQPAPAGRSIEIGNVLAEWVGEPADGAPVMLYLHGGGYAMGSRNTHRRLAMSLARKCGVAALLPEYRLAPEHPYPAALDDAYSAYRWLLEQTGSAARIAVAGDSAGGGLALALLLRIRDRGLEQPGCCVALSPWTDLASTGGSMETCRATDPAVSREAQDRLASLYLAGESAKNPGVSPLYGDLSGLAPLLLQVSEFEVLLDDSLRFEKKVRDAGGAVRCECWPGMVHVWHLYEGYLPEAEAALNGVGAFVREKLA